MTPQARQIIHEVGARRGLEPALILGKCRVRRLMLARVEIALLLTSRGYSTTQIGEVLNRDHTTVVFYLGRGKKKPSPKQRWRRPRVVVIWSKPKEPVVRKRRKFYLVPYAGAYMPEYEWKERRA